MPYMFIKLDFKKDKADGWERIEGIFQDLIPHKDSETIKDVLLDYLKGNYQKYGFLNKGDLELKNAKFCTLDKVKLRGHPKDVLIAALALALISKRVTQEEVQKIVNGE
jgi:hypothetical protein